MFKKDLSIFVIAVTTLYFIDVERINSMPFSSRTNFPLVHVYALSATEDRSDAVTRPQV